MKKVIRLTESDLNRIVRMVINESKFTIPSHIKERFNDIQHFLNSMPIRELYRKYKNFRDEGHSHEDLIHIDDDSKEYEDILIGILDAIGDRYEDEDNWREYQNKEYDLELASVIHSFFESMYEEKRNR